MYVYKQTEKKLWTVGFYAPDGKWHPESDHCTVLSAVKRVAYLNGNTLKDKIERLERELNNCAEMYDKEREDAEAALKSQFFKIQNMNHELIFFWQLQINKEKKDNPELKHLDLLKKFANEWKQVKEYSYNKHTFSFTTSSNTYFVDIKTLKIEL